MHTALFIHVNFLFQFPGLLPYLKNSDVDWQFIPENDQYSQQFHKNYRAELTSGKMLGGSSSLNFMAYTRGHYHVYDEWADKLKDSSWSWQSVLPYFIKSEKLLDPSVLSSLNGVFHGTNGLLEVTKLYRAESIKYLNAFGELGHYISNDLNGASNLGYAESMVTVADGMRQSTAYSFLRPIKDRPNLYVLKNTFVSKIILDDHQNAIGVEAILEDGTKCNYTAKKEIIVSAGAINTPKLLMLSGIGPKEHLNYKGIDVVMDLPVGQTFNDHVYVLLYNAVGKSNPPQPFNPKAYPFPLIIGSTTLNQYQDYPDYQTLNLLINNSTDMLGFCSFFFSYIDDICDALHEASKGREILFSLIVLIDPASRGKVLLRSSDPKDKPLIYTGYYSNSQDLEHHAKFIEDFITIYESDLFKQTDAKLIVPEVCGCGHLLGRKFWKCYALCMMSSGYHYVGTCPMGAVVDSRLQVYGIKKLRIVDASVMPKIPGSNTYAATVMIAEKAADMIKADYNYL